MAHPKKAPAARNPKPPVAKKGAAPSAVVAARKEQGLSVSLPMVSAIKAKMGLGKRRSRKVARATAANGNGRLSVNDLLRAKKLVDQIGAEREGGARGAGEAG